jgi:hypothetical protein
MDLIQGLAELADVITEAAAKYAIIYMIFKCAVWMAVNMPPLSTIFS